MIRIVGFCYATALASFGVLFADIEPAVAATHFVNCEPASWSGYSYYFDNNDPDGSPDKISYSKTTYVYSDKVGSKAKIHYNDTVTDGIVLNVYRKKYVVIAYVFGGVANMDTIFDTGLVINQYTKALIGKPAASMFYGQCQKY